MKTQKAKPPKRAAKPGTTTIQIDIQTRRDLKLLSALENASNVGIVIERLVREEMERRNLTGIRAS